MLSGRGGKDLANNTSACSLWSVVIVLSALMSCGTFPIVVFSPNFKYLAAFYILSLSARSHSSASSSVAGWHRDIVSPHLQPPFPGVVPFTPPGAQTRRNFSRMYRYDAVVLNHLSTIALRVVTAWPLGSGRVLHADMSQSRIHSSDGWNSCPTCLR